MRLIDALDEQERRICNLGGFARLKVTGITSDSRKVEPGFLFAVFVGTSCKSHSYLLEAIKNGAAVILLDKNDCDNITNLNVPILTVANPRSTYARIASRLYQPHPNTIVAITGTNGKTSTVNFLQQIWSKLGIGVSSIGTLGAKLSDGKEEVFLRFFTT